MAHTFASSAPAPTAICSAEPNSSQRRDQLVEFVRYGLDLRLGGRIGDGEAERDHASGISGAIAGHVIEGKLAL